MKMKSFVKLITLLAFIFFKASPIYSIVYVRYDGVNYKITSSEYRTVEVSNMGNCNMTNIELPTSIPIEEEITKLNKTYKVTHKYMVSSIGYDAFKGCTSLQSIIIPNSVSKIKSSAFEDWRGYVCHYW